MRKFTLDGSSVPGAQVVVKGFAGKGTITDMNGKFSLSVPTEATTLVVSFVGMKTQEVAIGGRTVVDVTLESEAIQMGDIVVTALGIKRERNETTYQTQSVDNSDLLKTTPNNAASALAGKVAGLQINVQDNGVKPTTQIILRGLRSVSGNNSALIVIDGSMASQGAFDNLNPNDIASISVLKGATAAALYGSNAANGAILVTTKQGQAGKKVTVGINSAYTIEKVSFMPDFQTEYGTGWEGAYDAVENTNWGPRFDGQLRQIGPTFPEGSQMNIQMVPYAPVENNVLDFFNNGNTFNNTVYVSGSSENSTFYASFGSQISDGIVIDDTYKRNTLRVNASKKIGSVELSVNSSYFTDIANVVGSSIGDQDRPLYWFLLNTAANIPLTSYSDWKNPLSYGHANNYFNAYYQNPYWAIGTNRDMEKSNRFIGNFSLNWEIKPWLKFSTRVASNNVWGTGKDWRAAQEYDHDLQPSAGAVSSFVEDTEFQSQTYSGDAILDGKFKFSQFTLKALVGSTINASNYRDSKVRANNLSIPDFYDISNGTGSLVGTVNEEKLRNFGYFGDLTLGFKDFVFVNFSGRSDRTSTLSPENNSYFYPSFGVSFIPSNAFEALVGNEFLSYSKITLSNSTVYNDLAPYRINETYSQSLGFPYSTINGFVLSNTAVDANITKEKITTTELGLNLGFLKGRMSFDASIFNTVTSDLITSTTPSVASASTVFLTNIGKLQGRGLELALNGTILKLGKFAWDMNVNYTYSETVVKEIYEGLDEIALTTTGQYGVYAVVGQKFPQIKANVYKKDPQGRVVVDAVSGHPLTENGLANLGRTTPPHIFGFNSALSYAGFSISGTVDYRTGHVYYEQGSDAMEFTGRSIASVSANRQDFVVPNSVIETSPGVFVENTNIAVQGGRQSYWTDVYNDVKSNYVKDATALKLREFAVNYTVPKNYINGLGIQKLSVGFIARNLLTFLPEENRFSDPEFNNTNNNAIGVGGYFQSPPTKTYGFSVNIEF